MADFVFPEDEGTNSNLGPNEGDFNDAANFAALFDAIGSTDFVATGLTLSNVSGGTFDLSKGKAVLTDTSATAGQANEDRNDGVAYVAELDARTGLSYTEGSQNFVFVDVPLTDNDVITVEVNTTDTAPNQPSLKIAEIDDSGTLTTSELNRLPDESFGSLEVETLIDGANVSHSGELADSADVSSIQSSSDVDHQQTTNRTHDGDALNPDSIANKDYNEASVTISSASGTTDLDLSQANLFRVEAVDNITITLSNISSSPAGNSVVVYIVDSDGAGPYTISWPASVVWNGGNAVDEVAQNSNIEASLLTDDGGTEIRGRLSGEEFA